VDGAVISSKDELELEKLRIEVEQLRNRWWSKPTYLALLVPICIAFFTFLGAVFSGYLSSERANMQAEIEQLRRERTSFAEHVSRLEEHLSRIRAADRKIEEVTRKAVEVRSVSGSAINAQQVRVFEGLSDSYKELRDIISRNPDDVKRGVK
jgi:hypothetical protein